jgi:hypothetical protein
VKLLTAYALPLALLVFNPQATAQDGNSLLHLLTTTTWEAPFFDQHIDFDTLALHKINRKKTYPRTKELRFLSSKQIKTGWFNKNIDHGCGLGLLSINQDSSFYSLKGDTLQATIKGEYIGMEEFYFKRDYLVKRVNDKEIRLVLIKTYFGKPCELLTRYRKELSEPTASVPPLPNLRKKQ